MHSPRPASQPGFTVIELMVTVAIVAVLAAIAVPSFQTVVVNMRLTSYANDFVASSMLARSTAISQNAPVTMCKSSNGTTCADSGSAGSWADGYLVTCQSNDGAVCTNTPATGATTIILGRQPSTATGWRITEAGNAVALVFQSTGTGATSATMTICRQTPTAGQYERVVRIGPTGRASVTKTALGTCG